MNEEHFNGPTVYGIMSEGGRSGDGERQREESPENTRLPPVHLTLPGEIKTVTLRNAHIHACAGTCSQTQQTHSNKLCRQIQEVQLKLLTL